MVEAALYILTGIAFYGGGHQLYLAAYRPGDHPHIMHGVMYCLLAGFALCGVFTYQAQAVATLLPLGKLSVTVGMLLWAGLIWFVAAYTDVRPRLGLAALSAAWAILLISNIGAPYSLLYSDVTPISQALTSGQTQLTWHTSINPWWSVVEIAILATLAYCVFATYQLFQRDDKRAALALACGLAVLAVTSFADFLITMQLVQSAYLTPYGFAVFLLACSLYPALRTEPEAPQAERAASSYNLTFNLHQAGPPRDAGSPAPLEASGAADVTPAPESGLTLEQAPESVGIRPRLEPESLPLEPASPMETAPSPREAEPPAVPEQAAEVEAAALPPEPAAEAAAPRPEPWTPDPATLSLMSDNLIDIAVNATMLMNRVKRGDIDPRTLEQLCNKVRSQAIETRRLANRLTRPRQGPPQQEDQDEG